MRSRKFSIHYSKFRMTKSGRGLRSARTSRREWRAFAGRSCGPLRPCGRKFSIQHSKLLLGLQPAERTQIRKRIAGLRAERLRPAVVPFRTVFVRHLRAAACEGTHEADLRDASGGPSRGKAAARCALRAQFILQKERGTHGPNGPI